MARFVKWVMSGLLLMVVIARPACPADYLGVVREAVVAIELGDYNAAASAIERAVVLDDSDPLAHMALGVVYMHTGRLGEADAEFMKVVEIQPGNWRAHYARGVIDTLRKRPDEAWEHFTLAGASPKASDEVAVLFSYFGFVKGDGSYRGRSVSDASPVGKQTAAMDAVKAGKQIEAAALLSEVLRTPGLLGLEESRAPLVTFDPERPVSLSQGKLTWKPTERRDAVVVSGIVTLRADVRDTAGVHFVAVYVDDIFAGATNYEPFEIEWNTVHYPNGLHQVRIEGRNEFGGGVSEKSFWVRLNNENPERRAPRSGPAAEELADRLWNCIRVSESRKLAHYQLAKLYLESGDRQGAVQQLEYAVAYQPDFRDARKLLNGLRGRQAKYTELSRGPAGSKIVALTFDDGPNERTEEMLAMLAELDVPATFFVVGFRAEAQPDLVRAMSAAGHEIESHTYSHANLSTLDANSAEAELSKTAAVLRAVTGEESRFFRPPGGHLDDTAKQAAGRQGFTGVFWTFSCSPYEGAGHDVLARRVIENASDGGIILMHNGEPSAISALPKIVAELRAQGYRFVTISEMASTAR